jgi:hypothetical protein
MSAVLRFRAPVRPTSLPLPGQDGRCPLRPAGRSRGALIGRQGLGQGCRGHVRLHLNAPRLLPEAYVYIGIGTLILIVILLIIFL